MKTTTLLLMLLISTFFAKAQQSTNTCGGNASSATGNISYTIGQIDYSNASGTNGNINMGVQHPFDIYPLGINNYPTITLQMSVYPNPTNAVLNLELDKLFSESLKYIIVDNLGKTIASNVITEPITKISFQQFALANYFLTVYDNNVALKSFQIIKNQ